MTEPTPVDIFEANLDDAEHARVIVDLISDYASEPVIRGRPLDDDVREALIPALREHPTTLVFLARVDGRVAGVAVCFLGFSTFAAKPLVNIHDLAVHREQRGRGVGRALLRHVEREARARGCAKVTLEVLARNEGAKRLYVREGYGSADPEAAGEQTLFLEKALR